MFHNIFGGFLVLELWFCIKYFVLDNCLSGDNSLCICSYKVSVVKLVFHSRFGIVLLDQIFYIADAAVPKSDDIAVKDFFEFVVLWEMLSDKLPTNICLYLLIMADQTM